MLTNSLVYRWKQLVDEGDRTTIWAVLMALDYLSGVSAVTAAGRRDQFYAQAEPRPTRNRLPRQGHDGSVGAGFGGRPAFMAQEAAQYGPVTASVGTFDVEPEAAWERHYWDDGSAGGGHPMAKNSAEILVRLIDQASAPARKIAK